MEDAVKRYYDTKVKCPICNRKVVETFLSPPQYVPGREYSDRVNVVLCNECGWRGKVDELRR